MEPVSAYGILALLALLQVKHAIGDGPLQTSRMVHEKGFYGLRGGLLHAAVHGAGTLLALLIFGLALLPALVLAAAEAVVHYHVDFFKESLARRNGWTQDKPVFWWALMADQMTHQLTYLAIAYAVIRLAS
jgi:hypothetical protein